MISPCPITTGQRFTSYLDHVCCTLQSSITPFSSMPPRQPDFLRQWSKAIAAVSLFFVSLPFTNLFFHSCHSLVFFRLLFELRFDICVLQLIFLLVLTTWSAKHSRKAQMKFSRRVLCKCGSAKNAKHLRGSGDFSSLARRFQPGETLCEIQSRLSEQTRNCSV